MGTESEKLVADIKILIGDAEEFVRATAMETGAKVTELRRRVQDSMGDVKSNMAKLETTVVERVKPAATAADDYVRAHPWEAIGVSAIAGLLIGLLASRR